MCLRLIVSRNFEAMATIDARTNPAMPNLSVTTAGGMISVRMSAVMKTDFRFAGTCNSQARNRFVAQQTAVISTKEKASAPGSFGASLNSPRPNATSKRVTR